jgi:protein-S-isoprenylcysteine O-methyltransferase Ste14
MGVRDLVGSGDRIALAILPVVAMGVVLNVAFPRVFSVGGPFGWLRIVAAGAAIVGVIVWLWSVGLLVTRARRGELITTGPYAVVKHPLYTGVALLVLPAIGLLLDTWLGVVIGVAMYVAARRFAPAEEVSLAERFGDAWWDYADRVALPNV